MTKATAPIIGGEMAAPVESRGFNRRRLLRCIPYPLSSRYGKLAADGHIALAVPVTMPTRKLLITAARPAPPCNFLPTNLPISIKN